MKIIKKPLEVKYENITDESLIECIQSVFNLLFNKIKIDYQFDKLTLIVFVEEEGGEFIQYLIDSSEINQQNLLTTKSNVTMINLN